MRHLYEAGYRNIAFFSLEFSGPYEGVTDNTSYCDLAQNRLTSIDQSGQVLGLQAARLLIERIKGRTTAAHLVVTPRLVARASSSAKRA